jgi:hypothetical protein
MPPFCDYLLLDKGIDAVPTAAEILPNDPHNRHCVMPTTELSSWDVERRDDDTVLVRVHSNSRQGRQLPDAVFSFRCGDPQYDYWASQLFERMQNQLAQ